MPLARWFALPALLLALAACEDSQDRADAFFEDGVELREAGDLDRAAVSFRNVFRFDGTHREARTQLAEVLLEQGNPNGAFSQYLRLAEQYPDDVEVRLALSEIAARLQAWSELARHGAVAAELAPERPEARALAAMTDFIEAAQADDAAARDAAVADAEALLASDPDLVVARRLAIAGHLDAKRLEEALVWIERSLEEAPDDRALGLTKLQVLASLERDAEIEPYLVGLYERFPADEEIRTALIAWYVQNQDLDAVEDLLRARAGGPEGPVEDNVTLVRFIAETRGVPAARAALGELIAATEDDPATADRYVRIDAAYAATTGEIEEGIALLRARLDGGPETETTPELKTMLAQMLLRTGDRVGARALVEDVLATDESNVAALKMRSEWLIEADETAEAISALRTALDQAPNDPDILTLMAQAHLRAGSVELAGERLALAVSVSENGPEEAVRYARFLSERGRVGPARALLAESVAANPGELDLLTEQARLALSEGDAPAARQAIARIEGIADDPVAADRAKALRAALLLGQERFEEGIALLEERAEGEADGAVVLDVVRTRLRAGQTEEARAYLAARLAERPEDPSLRFADAMLRLAEGEIETAETALRALSEEFPEAEGPVRQLYGLLRREGRAEEAEAFLSAAIGRMDTPTELLLISAGNLEAQGDLEGALAVYRRLYESESDNLVVANNYASLLSDLRSDEESLERAALIARRLAASQNPALQDTYGWVAYRQGKFEEALENLEPAAAGLPENPVVLYHLGMTYLALDRIEEARETLGRAVEIGRDQPIVQLERAREALEGL